MASTFDFWTEQMEAHDRAMQALRGDGAEQGGARADGSDTARGGPHGVGYGHGGGQGRQRFTYTNKPLDPRRADDPVVNALFDIVGADAEILDVGGGSGRLAMPLATRAKHVTVVEPSEDSTELLKSRAAEAEITNITVINEAWEDAQTPPADIVLCSLVLHHVLDAVPFVERLAQHAKERVVIAEMMETPGAIEMPFYERVHGSVPAPLPGLPRILELLWAMEIFPDVRMVEPEPAVLDADRDDVLEHLRRRLAVTEGSDADERLRAAAADLLIDTPEGLSVRGAAPRRSAIISWRPAR